VSQPEPAATTGGLPALTENLNLRYVAFTLLYAAQGLPYGLLSIAVPAYMAEQGLTPTQISSYMGIILLPWSLKLINGPIMDRWSYLVMGRRRPWILLAQAGMVTTSVIMALTPDPMQHLFALTALGFLTNFFTAFQDVAVDGMAVEIIPVEQQPKANGFMWGGKGLGVAGATAGGATASAQRCWPRPSLSPSSCCCRCWPGNARENACCRGRPGRLPMCPAPCSWRAGSISDDRCCGWSCCRSV
jgi:PAT family beta-lactamase induction signal transducer AmpG